MNEKEEGQFYYHKTSEEILNRITEVCIEQKASDIHIDPVVQDINGTIRKMAIIQFRINGILQIRDEIPISKYFEILSRIKISCNLRIDDHTTPKDGSFGDFRVSIMPTKNGENIVLRYLKNSSKLSLKDIGVSEKDRQMILFSLSKPGSIGIVLGPTGSGKTTTLYALLNELKTESLVAISIEDPIESELQGIRQIQISSGNTVSFSNALRSALRQDPDIIMVGEIRDYETGLLAFQAALTGHIVITSIHAFNSEQLIPRLLSLGIPTYLLESLSVVSINQRLIECLCDFCKREIELSPDQINIWKKFIEGSSLPSTLYMSEGCERCNFSGVGGRILAYEIDKATKSIHQMIIDLILSSKVSYKFIESLR